MAIGLSQAEKYFSIRVKADAWVDAGDIDKQKALATAERQLSPYRNRVDGTRFSYAVFEQALWLLQGDERSELQQAGVVSMTIGSLSETYGNTGRDPTIAPQAWAFIRGPTVKTGGLA